MADLAQERLKFGSVPNHCDDEQDDENGSAGDVCGVEREVKHEGVKGEWSKNDRGEADCLVGCEEYRAQKVEDSKRGHDVGSSDGHHEGGGVAREFRHRHEAEKFIEAEYEHHEGEKVAGNECDFGHLACGS